MTSSTCKEELDIEEKKCRFAQPINKLNKQKLWEKVIKKAVKVKLQWVLMA
jgi:hypothetical protein